MTWCQEKNRRKDKFLRFFLQVSEKYSTFAANYYLLIIIKQKSMKAHSKQYRKLHFAVMVIEAAAKMQKVTGDVMYQRLKAQDLIRQRLLQHYEALHTQSLDWVVEDTIETLNNWEKEGKEYAQ